MNPTQALDHSANPGNRASDPGDGTGGAGQGMGMGEFDLIHRHFTQPAAALQAALAAQDRLSHPSPQLVLGIGDDCALLQPTPGMQLAISSDMLVEGRHFFPDVNPATLGHKALAVNLSDLAACGARPLGFTLALALPALDTAWLDGFSRGLMAVARTFRCPLVGGDTTRGPLNLCITVFGEVPPRQALLRSGAQVDDDVYVSGHLGDARLALLARQHPLRWPLPTEVLTSARHRLECPTPRVALGLALRGIATAAADVSDGLAGDLGHVLRASGVGATLSAESIIKTIASKPYIESGGGTFHLNEWLALALDGGDDYELVFTAAPAQRDAVLAAARDAATAVTLIGHIERAPGLRVTRAGGPPTHWRAQSFDHFA
jgi:thiamine-monophosphate kinase